MSNPWENDPIVKPAESKAMPWDNDPIVKPVEDQSVLSPEFTKEQLSDTGNEIKTAITSPGAAVLNAGNTIGRVLTGKKDSGSLDAQVAEMNQTREGWMQGNTTAQGMDLAGQMAAPVPKIGLVGEAAKGAGFMTKAAKWVGRGAEHVAEGAGAGAEFASMQANPVTSNGEDARNQALQKVETGAKVGGVLNAATGAVGSLYNGAKKLTSGWFSDNVAKQRVGESLGKDQDLVNKLEAHVKDPNGKDLNLTDVTQNPDIASAEKALFKGADKTKLDQRRQTTNSQLSDELEHLNLLDTAPIEGAASSEVGNAQSVIDTRYQPMPKVTAPEVDNAITPVQAQEQVGGVARDVSNSERQAIKDSYTAIAPDDTVQAPLEKLQANMDRVREKHKIADDNTLSEIDNRYSGESETNTGSVKQMIQDKNALGDYINNQYRVLKNPNAVIDADMSAGISKKIEAAKEMRDALKGHLEGLADVPSGVEGKSVSQAFGEAEGRYKEHNQKYLSNLEQFKTTAEGKQYGFSSSEFGDYDYRLQKGAAGSLAEEGKKLLPIENPDALGSALKTLRSVPDADGLVKTNILANIKARGFDKAFNPEVQAQLTANGFENVANEISAIGKTLKSKNYQTEQLNTYLDGIKQDEQRKLEATFASRVLKEGDVAKLMQDKEMQKQALELANKQNDNGATARGLGQSVLDQIKKDSISKSPNTLGEGEISTVDYDEFYAHFSANRDFLKKTLPPDEFKALETLNRELQQNTFMARTNAGSENTVVQDKSGEKLNDIALKSALSKIAGVPIGGAASFGTMMRGITRGRIEKVVKEAIADPAKALELINAAKAGAKDPTIFSKTIDAMYDRIPAVGSAITPPTDVRSDKHAVLDNTTSSVPNVPSRPEQQLDKESSNETSSDFSFISSANASEFPSGGAGVKKGPATGEYQVADNQMISEISKKTGLSEAYFRGLEKHETRGQANPDTARNPNSTAFGRGQFLEATWNGLAAKNHEIPAITPKNRYTQHDPRANPYYSRLATGINTLNNLEEMKKWLGRDPTEADSYGAHLMGPTGFKQFINARPSTPAANVVPAAAKNNKPLFYRDGKALPIREVYKNLEDHFLVSKTKDQTGESDMEPYND